MSTTIKHADVSPQAIWAVLADPDSYAYWVVGAKEVRGVLGNWPQLDAQIQHSVGVGDVKNKDNTVVIEVTAPTHLKLRAQIRPFAVAEVTIDVSTNDSGTQIVMHETTVAGPASFVPQKLIDVAMHPRNVKTLDRLVKLAKQTT